MWIESQWAVGFSVSSFLPRMRMVLRVAAIFGISTQVCAGQTIIAAKRTHDFYISLMSQSGKLAEKDEYCVLFSRTNGGEPTQVGSVVVEFVQQVGKVRESAIEILLVLDSRGRYCGEVDLGKQYYHPAYYYIEIHYTDSSKRKKKCRFFLTRR
jgi:hypothetical protein